jgi:hypothetical protein
MENIAKLVHKAFFYESHGEKTKAIECYDDAYSLLEKIIDDDPNDKLRWLYMHRAGSYKTRSKLLQYDLI